eukprot:81725-Pleurochrysis_carterae.AAC.1
MDMYPILGSKILFASGPVFLLSRLPFSTLVRHLFCTFVYSSSSLFRLCALEGHYLSFLKRVGTFKNNMNGALAHQFLAAR